MRPMRPTLHVHDEVATETKLFWAVTAISQSLAVKRLRCNGTCLSSRQKATL